MQRSTRPLRYNIYTVLFEELNLPLSKEDILNAIKQLKTNRSGGPDRILNEFFIHGKDIVTTLCNLFNKIYEKGHFPDNWTEGYLIPLHKNGSVNDAELWRYNVIKHIWQVIY